MKYANLIWLLIFLSQCTDSHHTQTKSTQSTNIVEREHFKKLLKTGPIILGENHEQPFARELIVALIIDKAVKKLFLEIPEITVDENLSTNPTHGSPSCYLKNSSRQYDDTFATTIESCINQRATDRSFKLGSLIKYALKHGKFPIYLHDAPLKLVGSQEDAMTEKGLITRNQYAEKIIKPHLQDSNQGAGVVILVGRGHIFSSVIENGQVKKLNLQNEDMLLQNLLHISENSTFVLSESVKGLNPSIISSRFNRMAADDNDA